MNDEPPDLPDGRVLRLLDANANRAREALRVVEDYARFVLDDNEATGALKALRHDFAAATRLFVAGAILHRDTPGDVGTGITATGERSREGLSDVVTAAGKRLGEALRAVEEFLKTLSPPDAARVEQLRYRFYDLEHRLAFSFRPAPLRFAPVRLYVLITESLCRIPWLDAAEQAILGGADCLQLREKDLEGGELLCRAKQLVALCRRHGVSCLVNDRPDVAVLAGADGVHVGQGDLPAREARKIVGPDRIVGVSTHDLGQAKRAAADGADYIGVGPVFRSPTKPRQFTAGLAFVRAVADHLPRLPAVAIAGITAANVDEVLAAGARAVAVTSAVLSAENVRAAAAEFKAKVSRAPAPTEGQGCPSQP